MALNTEIALVHLISAICSVFSGMLSEIEAAPEPLTALSQHASSASSYSLGANAERDDALISSAASRGLEQLGVTLKYLGPVRYIRVIHCLTRYPC